LSPDAFIWNVAGLDLNITSTKSLDVNDNWIQFWLDGLFVAPPNSTAADIPRAPIGDWVERAHMP